MAQPNFVDPKPWVEAELKKALGPLEEEYALAKSWRERRRVRRAISARRREVLRSLRSNSPVGW